MLTNKDLNNKIMYERLVKDLWGYIHEYMSGGGLKVIQVTTTVRIINGIIIEENNAVSD